MENKSMSESPDISGVPEEIQEGIIKDLEKKVKEPSGSLPKIGISVSENEDLGILGYSNIHLRDLTIEIARHLLINDYVLVYGGDLRREGFTEAFSDLAYQYRSIGKLKSFCFENYFAYPIYCSITKHNELEFKKHRTKVIRIPPPQELSIDAHEYIPPITEEQKFIWATSLTKMRNQMIASTNARILIGGKCNNYLGKMPGIIEEAKITLTMDKPLFLIGAFGGASRQVINAIRGKGFSYSNSDFHKSSSFMTFKSFYNDKVAENKIDIKEDELMFSRYGLENLSKKNGLTIEENIRLFETPHLSEIIFYIFKGLSRISAY